MADTLPTAADVETVSRETFRREALKHHLAFAAASRTYLPTIITGGEALFVKRALAGYAGQRFLESDMRWIFRRLVKAEEILQRQYRAKARSQQQMLVNMKSATRRPQ